MTPRITLSIFWMETSPATWRAACSRPPDRDLSPSLFPPGQIQLDRFPEGFNFNFRSQQG